MAKRKRLTPPAPSASAAPDQIETKAMFPMGLAPRAAPPIAVEAARASGEAALQDMAETLHKARAEGRMVLSLMLDQIVVEHLIRDRISLDSEDLESLRTSIAARGQQAPIEVTDLGEGRYGLISGLRRLTVLRHLHETDPTGGFGTVQALLRTPADSAQAYLAMVEENEIRSGLSYYERARIAAKAAEQGAFKTPRDALPSLYATASRPKRSKIGAFLRIVDTLDGALAFPELIGERLGLKLAGALSDDVGLANRLIAALAAAPPADAAAEARAIESVITPAKTTSKGSKATLQTNTSVNLRRKGTRLTLEGPGVDDAFEEAIKTFIASLSRDVSRAKQ